MTARQSAATDRGLALIAAGATLRAAAATSGVAVSTLAGSDRVNTMAAVAPLIGAVSIEVERVRSEQPADTIAP